MHDKNNGFCLGEGGETRLKHQLSGARETGTPKRQIPLTGK